MKFIYVAQDADVFPLCVPEQPVTTPCIRSQPRMEKTSRTFCPSIWTLCSSLVYESRTSGESDSSLCFFTHI